MRPENKSPEKTVTRHHWKGTIVLLILLSLILVYLWMCLSANTINVRHAEIVVDDLPESFDGTTILFLSDIDLSGCHSEEWFSKLCNTLRPLDPDIVIVNGSFYTTTWFDRLNTTASIAQNTHYDRVFSILSDIQAPMGSYYIIGNSDAPSEVIARISAEYGIKDLTIEPTILDKDGYSIGLVGIDNNTSDIAALASGIKHDRCVITVLHSPALASSVRIQEAADGGSWSDLILTGHTHGGLVRLFGSSILQLSDKEKVYLSGWYTDGSQPMLVSSGVGTDGLGLRLGTKSEVWMVELHTIANATDSTIRLTLE